MQASIENYFKCYYCKQIAKEAVQGQCCGSIYCQSCYNQINSQKKRCSICKIIGFRAQPSMFARRIIGNFKTKCRYGCPADITYAQKQQHQDMCPFKTITCKKCKQLVTLGNIVNHMRQKHPKQLNLIMIQHNIGLNQQQKVSSNSKIKNKKIPKFFQRKTKNSDGDIAQLGETGKYYCGKKKLIGRCDCCDGYCGNINGENCDSCMQLDCQRINLPKGYLINTNGLVCKKGEKNGVYYCGIKMKGNLFKKGTFCNEDKQCKDCFKMNYSVQKLGRYKNLV